jgi:mRNA interferase RelE/StbE
VYRINIIPSARKDLDLLDEKIFTQIKNRIISLASNPRPSGSLKLTAEEGYRIRSGNYRILYRVDDKNKMIYVYRVKHRKESYR